MEYWLIATTDEQGKEGVGGGMMKRQDRKIEVLGPDRNAATNLLRRQELRYEEHRAGDLGDRTHARLAKSEPDLCHFAPVLA